MISRHTERLAAVALSMAFVPALISAAPAPPGGIRLVHPGESVQAAVDAARPGDVIELLAGVHKGSVTLSTDRVTLRGQGERTVLQPDSGGQGSCARAGHGLCIVGRPGAPVTGVTIESLTLTGFAKNGLNASGTDALTVRAVLAHHNGQQGISQELSTRSVLLGNEARDNGQAGIFVANTVDSEGGALETHGTSISGNRLSGNRIGVVLRRVRTLAVEDNIIGDNCGGVFVVGDEGVPRAGALTVRRNTVRSNNRFCPKTPRLDFIQGTGILLTGTEDTTVTDNQVSDNTGASPMSGGIVLFRSLVGAPNARANVTGNLLHGNGPADLADRDTGLGNLFMHNVCRVSEPAGHC